MKHTDQAINVALAKAIGYRDEDIRFNSQCVAIRWGLAWIGFNFKSPSVIWPIAAKYNAFPYRTFGGSWTINGITDYFPTPELAVAMGVIEMKEVKI